MRPRQGRCPDAISGNRTIPFTISDCGFREAAHQPCSRISKIQLVCGSTTVACQFVIRKSKIANFKRGCGRQAMHLLCKQGYVGALPTNSTILFTAGNSTKAQSEAS